MSRDNSLPRRQLLRDGAWVGLGFAGTLGFKFVANVLLSRILPPGAYGSYLLAMSIAVGAATVARFGVDKAIVKSVSESIELGDEARAASLLRMGLLLASVGGLVSAGLLLTGSAEIADFFADPELGKEIYWVAAAVFLLSVQVTATESFRGLRRMAQASTLGPALSGLVIIIVLAFAWFNSVPLDLPDILKLNATALCLSVLVASAALFFHQRTTKERSVGDWGGLVRLAFPLWVTGVLRYCADGADIWILGHNVPNEELAVYGAATRLALLASIPLVLANLVIAPRIAAHLASERIGALQRELRGVAAAAAIPSLIAIALFTGLGGSALALAFGSYYERGATLLVILSSARMVEALTGSCGTVLMMGGQQRAMMWIGGSCSVLSVGLSILVAPTYGTTGVALSVGAGVVLTNLIAWGTARRLLGVWTHPSLRQIGAVFEKR